MKNEKKIEELQGNLFTLVNGLNSVTLRLDIYYIFEDCIFNKDFIGAVDLLKSNDLTINDNDRSALLYIFENASLTYKNLTS